MNASPRTAYPAEYVGTFVKPPRSSMPRIPLSIKFRALFARDNHAFWWNEFTDEERELGKMNTRELAEALQDAQNRGDNERGILIEHMLSGRLAQLKARASWGSGFLGFVGAVIGAAITVGLATGSPPCPEPRFTAKCECLQPALSLTPPPASSSTKDTSLVGPVQKGN